MTDRTAHSLALEVTDDLNRAVSLCRAIGVLSDVGVETSEAETALLHQLEDTAKIAGRLRDMLQESAS